MARSALRFLKASSTATSWMQYCQRMAGSLSIRLGAQQIAAFAAADLAQPASVEGKGEAGRGRLDLDVNQAPADRSLGASGSQLHQQLLAGGLHCGEFVEASPQPFQLSPA